MNIFWFAVCGYLLFAFVDGFKQGWRTEEIVRSARGTFLDLMRNRKSVSATQESLSSARIKNLVQ